MGGKHSRPHTEEEDPKYPHTQRRDDEEDSKCHLEEAKHQRGDTHDPVEPFPTDAAFGWQLIFLHMWATAG